MDPNSNRILLGAAGAGGRVYFFLTLGLSSSDEQSLDISLDSAGNIYVCGNYQTGGVVQGPLLCKVDAQGIYQWGRAFGSGDSKAGAFGVSADNSNNVYFGGQIGNAGRSYILFVKYSDTGTLQWQRARGDTGQDSFIRGVVTDSSANVYGCGKDVAAGPGYIGKYNSAGTFVWQKRWGTTPVTGIGIDSSSNIYISALRDQVFTNDSVTVVKVDSNGNKLWARDVNSGGIFSSESSKIAVTSSGRSYFAARLPNNDIIIGCLDTDGTAQWFRKLTDTSASFNAFFTVNGMTTDSEGNVYIVGDTNDTPDEKTQGYVVKYNSSGTLQWQRQLRFGTPVNSNSATGIKIDSLGDMYISYIVDASQNIAIIKLPSDGSLLGTYGSFTYAAANFTATTPSLSATSNGFTLADPAFTNNLNISRTDTALTSSSSIITF